MTTARELQMLGVAFAAEIAASMNNAIPWVIQPRGKLAEKLVTDGLLQHAVQILDGLPPVHITGYSLTALGRMTYCMSCKDEPEERAP